MVLKRVIMIGGLLALATPAWAHTGVGLSSGFASGFTHPLHGQDHVLAMVTVGLLAALLRGRALWAVPASFVGMMLVGGGLGLSGFAVPAVEAGILMSIAVLGAVVAWGRTVPVSLAMALAGLFAVFHGYAHGTEIPLSVSAASYSLGFAAATILLHGVGIAAGRTVFGSPKVLRIAGAAIALAGVATVIS